MVVINQNNDLNSGEYSSPEISLDSNLKRWFSRNIGLGNLIEHIFLKTKIKLTIYV